MGDVVCQERSHPWRMRHICPTASRHNHVELQVRERSQTARAGFSKGAKIRELGEQSQAACMANASSQTSTTRPPLSGLGKQTQERWRTLKFENRSQSQLPIQCQGTKP